MTTILHHRYAPRGTARSLFGIRARQVLLSGPAGTGKSRACLEKGHLMALKNPGSRGLIVRKTAASLTSTALVTYREHVAKEAIEAGDVTWYGGSSQEAPGYRYSNGSVINVGGMDKPSKIMSSEYDWAYVQEAIELTETDWEAITTRLRNGVISFQQLMADTNPAAQTHWLKVKADRTSSDDGFVMLDTKHTDNPRMYREVLTDEGVSYEITEYGRSYMAVLEDLTGVRKLRLKDGLWVAAEGMIYEDVWNESIHIVDRFQIPSSWRRWWAVDFGFTHPFVLQCWAEDPDGRAYMYREIFHTRRLVEDHARTILDIVAPGTTWDKDGVVSYGEWIEPRPTSIICDHDAEDRATLEKWLGLSTTPAHKSVKDGIEAVASRMKVAGDGKARLYFLRDSVVARDPNLVQKKRPTCTVEEIPGYVWNEAKDAPVKELDDGCDTARYFVAERELGGTLNVRWIG